MVTVSLKESELISGSIVRRELKYFQLEFDRLLSSLVPESGPEGTFSSLAELRILVEDFLARIRRVARFLDADGNCVEQVLELRLAHKSEKMEELRNLEDEISLLLDNIQGAEHELKGYQDELASVEKNTKKTLKELKKAEKETKRRVSEAEKHLQETTLRVNRELGELQQQILASENEELTARAHLTQKNRQIVERKEEIRRKTEEVDQIGKDGKSLLDKRLKSFEIEKQALQRAIDNLAKTNDDLRRQIQGMETERDSLRRELEAAFGLEFDNQALRRLVQAARGGEETPNLEAFGIRRVGESPSPRRVPTMEGVAGPSGIRSSQMPAISSQVTSS